LPLRAGPALILRDLLPLMGDMPSTELDSAVYKTLLESTRAIPW
jgi:hypothetical protein